MSLRRRMTRDDAMYAIGACIGFLALLALGFVLVTMVFTQ